MATYVIGDVHGQYAALLSLLDKLHYDEASDELWFVGDLVNRGPNSLEVVRFVCDLFQRGKCKVVLGNHDFSLLAQAIPGSTLKPKKATQSILAAEDGEALIMQMRQFPLLVVDDSHHVVMTHAGFYPLWTLSIAQRLNADVMAALQGEQVGDFLRDVYADEPADWDINRTGIPALRFAVNVFTRMRYLKKDLRLDFDCKLPPKEAPRNLMPWFAVPQADEYRCVFGHWAALGLTIKPHYACIDGGAAWDGMLIAFDLARWQVAGKIKV